MRARACRWHFWCKRFALKVVANIGINFRSSCAPSQLATCIESKCLCQGSKDEPCRRVVQQFASTMEFTCTKTCGSVNVGDVELEPAMLVSCSLGCMVLGTCGCAALWCIPLDVHSNVDAFVHVQDYTEQFLEGDARGGVVAFQTHTRIACNAGSCRDSCDIEHLSSGRRVPFAMLCPLHALLSGMIQSKWKI